MVFLDFVYVVCLAVRFYSRLSCILILASGLSRFWWC